MPATASVPALATCAAVRGRGRFTVMPTRERRGSAKPETGSVLVNGREVPYLIRRSARRKKTLELTVRDGVVAVAAPRRVSGGDIREFVLSKADWIAERLARPAQPTLRNQLREGGELPWLGVPHAVVLDPAASEPVALTLLDIRFKADGAEEMAADFERWGRARAAEYIRERVGHWAPVLGVRPGKITIRSQKRRWGSASRSGNLQFNWRLMLVPPRLIDYVVVHELSHLRHPNHGAEFWAYLDGQMPGAKQLQRELHQRGLELDW